jgi:adenine-specific DNA-methyltransferase
MPRPRRRAAPVTNRASNYQHTEATQLLKPEVGTQPLFKKKKPPATYRYDSSLSPALDWDNNPVREQGEALLRQMRDAKTLDEAKAAAAQLAALARPFLNWTGKAERLSFDVPTLPLFVHERLSTRAILETLKAHKRDKQEDFITGLFGNPSLPVTDQVLRAYEHREKWQNRMILGDSLAVMNSLLRFENLGGQVQMIYLDPPYGVKFGSNFQPFVRKRGTATDNDDEHATREPEMVQAYRDTWELGLHSYLTYLRDRLLLARDLLHPSGSIFVQISDENIHHVREVLDEVFGAENFVSQIAFVKTTSSTSNTLSSVYDTLLWFARDRERLKYRPLFSLKIRGQQGATGYTRVLSQDGKIEPASDFENEEGELVLPEGAFLVALDNITSQNPGSRYDVPFNGRIFRPEPGYWKTDEAGMKILLTAGRIASTENKLAFIRKITDFPAYPLANVWTDTLGQNQFGGKKLYCVQTALTVIRRCMLMTTSPGDLVLDPTCGSGTTAYVAEQWGRRWITMDTSRVPLALARQRLLTATFDYYDLNEEKRGPASGFVYLPEGKTRNAKGIGPGIVPHVKLESIANNEPPGEEVLVDRPEINRGIVRVTGPFTVEATIPTPVDWEGDGVEDSGARTTEEYGNFVSRMIEILRRNPVLRLDGNRSVTLRKVRPPARTLSLHAEALVKQPTLESLAQETEAQKSLMNAGEKPVAFVFGPEHGAVSHKLVENAAIEARRKDYSHLYVIGFAIEAGARKTIQDSEAALNIPATYVQATPDILMGDLLKTMRSSQIFSVCGLPEIEVTSAPPGKSGEPLYQVELLGLDVFDPVEMKSDHRSGMDVPAWLLDTDYNGTVFRVCQAFFPRTGAWENLKRELRAEFEERVWAHLAGTTSAPFLAGPNKTIAVKVIDDRGNELLVTKALSEKETRL